MVVAFFILVVSTKMIIGSIYQFRSNLWYDGGISISQTRNKLEYQSFFDTRAAMFDNWLDRF